MFKSLRKKASLLSLLQQEELGSPGSHARYLKVLKQVHDFEIALQAMDYLLDDRGPEGSDLLEKELKSHKENTPKDPAAIFHLAMGVMQFIEATLGFETEVMNRAHNTLAQAEEASLNNSKINQREEILTSHIYLPGTEFQVTYAELTLLNALVMLLHENNGMVEQAKALFKLRRAYQILDSTYKKIKELEGLFKRNLAKFRKQANSSSISSVDLPGFKIPPTMSDGRSTESLPADVSLMENLEAVFLMRKARVQGTSVSTPLLRKGTSPTPLTNMANSSTFSDVPPATSGNSSRGPSQNNANSNSKFARNAPENEDDSDDDNDEFSDASESVSTSKATTTLDPLFGKDTRRPSSQSMSSTVLSLDTSDSGEETGNAHFHVSTIDEFIHSGVQLCFGILQVVLSLIPPAIGKVLSIVGFRGSRDVGLAMLWRTAITARNIHGALALLCLLVFYDGPIQFIDVGFQLPGHEDSSIKDVINISERSSVSDAELDKIVKNPNLYTPQILAKARELFPHNALWLLQEGRMLAARGKIHEALKIMQDFTDDPTTSIQMNQIEALLTFDRAMLYAFVHDYDAAARDFLRLLDINSWSLAVYLFIAGSCYLEKWRMIQADEVKFDLPEEKEKALEEYAKKADHHLKLAPTYVPGHGHNAVKKKGGIGGSNKQMPFDKFVLRKTKHIEERQKRYPKLSYIECVGTSLIHELVYFWNGYNRMTTEDLEILHRMLKFSNSPLAKVEETSDEAMIRNLFESIVLRQLGRVEEGLSQLDKEVIAKYVVLDNAATGFKFTKMTYSPYLYPTALYEKAMFVWLLEVSKDSKKAIEKSILWLKKADTVSDIGDYELSNRTSMRIKAATERLDSLKAFV